MPRSPTHSTSRCAPSTSTAPFRSSTCDTSRSAFSEAGDGPSERAVADLCCEMDRGDSCLVDAEAPAQDMQHLQLFRLDLQVGDGDVEIGRASCRERV